MLEAKEEEDNGEKKAEIDEDSPRELKSFS